MKIEITLRNHLFLLLGSGEGSALVDADPVVTPEGFPFVPGRTLKGLFRESVEEVLEIEGRASESVAICTRLFGREDGDQEAWLNFRDLHLEGYAAMSRDLPRCRELNPWAFSPGRILATTLRASW